jgi:hypothetical protein
MAAATGKICVLGRDGQEIDLLPASSDLSPPDPAGCAIATGVAICWILKLASPLCGPALLLCALAG